MSSFLQIDRGTLKSLLNDAASAASNLEFFTGLLTDHGSTMLKFIVWQAASLLPRCRQVLFRTLPVTSPIQTGCVSLTSSIIGEWDLTIALHLSLPMTEAGMYVGIYLFKTNIC